MTTMSGEEGRREGSYSSIPWERTGAWKTTFLKLRKTTGRRKKEQRQVPRSVTRSMILRRILERRHSKTTAGRTMMVTRGGSRGIIRKQRRNKDRWVIDRVGISHTEI